MTTTTHSKVADLEIPDFPYRVSRDDIANILCSAFEGGSTYWLRRVSGTHPAAEYKSDVVSCGGTLRLVYDDPNQDEGNGKGRFDLTLSTLLLGISRMLKFRNGSRFSMSDVNGDLQDAETADCVLQFTIFGDIVYG